MRTSDRGARSETVDAVRCNVGRGPHLGGLEERIPVLEVGIGVGYFRNAPEVACRFKGRGNPGEEDRGSKGGSNEGAGLLVPAVVGSEGSRALFAEGEESITVKQQS